MSEAVQGRAELVRLLRADGEYVWALEHVVGDAWRLARTLPTGTRRTITLHPTLAAELRRRWGRTRKGRPVGVQSAGRLVHWLQQAPQQALPDPYPVGAVVQHDGRAYTIAHATRGKRRQGGTSYMRVLATGDGGEAVLGSPCTCTAPRAVRVVDLVTETQYRVCGACRKLMPGEAS